MMDYVVEAKSHIDSLNAVFLQVSDSIAKRRDELVVIENDILEKKRLADTAYRLLEKTKEEVAKEQAYLENDIKSLRSRKQDLETEVSSLTSKVGELKIKNANLGTENTKFKSYEEKAWKSLRAKEQSLIEREAALIQKESLRPGHKTLLPPIE